MKLRNVPTAALAVTTLVFATTGSAVATSYITGKQVKDSSLTGRDIKNKSLTPADFKGSVQGPEGPQGLQGIPGVQGAPGLSNVTSVTSPDTIIYPGDVGGAQAFCPAGTRPIGTGAYAGIGSLGFVTAYDSSVGIGVINDSSIPINIHAQAICATVTGPAVARSTRSDRFNSDLESLRK